MDGLCSVLEVNLRHRMLKFPKSKNKMRAYPASGKAKRRLRRRSQPHMNQSESIEEVLLKTSMTNSIKFLLTKKIQITLVI
jgi:hypothetical protein